MNLSLICPVSSHSLACRPRKKAASPWPIVSIICRRIARAHTFRSYEYNKRHNQNYRVLHRCGVEKGHETASRTRGFKPPTPGVGSASRRRDGGSKEGVNTHGHTRARRRTRRTTCLVQRSHHAYHVLVGTHGVVHLFFV